MRSTLEALSDETRLRIVEELGTGSRTAGQLAALFQISRPGVSRHLRVLREARVVTARSEGQRRLYELVPESLAEIDDWLSRYRHLWSHRLEALDTEVGRIKRERGTEARRRKSAKAKT